jgi:mono/diheme cytochrome c family protein
MKTTHHASLAAGLLLALAAAASPGCGNGSDAEGAAGTAGTAGSAGAGGKPTGPGTTPQGTVVGKLDVQSVLWNADETKAPSGAIAAVAEAGANVVVFSDKGALVYSGGSLLSSDTSQTSWLGAASIPAGAGDEGVWVVGVDGKGQLQHLAALSHLDPVSDRYGLAKDALVAVAPLGTMVAFSLPTQLAVADGTKVTRYDFDAVRWVGGTDKRALGLAKDTLITYEPGGAASKYPVPDIRAAVLDPGGKLVVENDTQIYLEQADGSLAVAYTSDGSGLHGLVRSGDRIWFAVGGELGTLGAGAFAITQGAGIAADAQLTGSPTGDVWALAAGKLARFSAGRDANEAAWLATIQPAFSRSCATCHLPGGTANHDLSTYDSWVADRTKIRNRVLEKKDMPPAGIALSDADRMAIDTWTAMMK